MEVVVDKPDGLEHKVKVKVPEDRIAAEVATRLQRLTQTARISGFRQGKAPIRVIEQRFGAQVRREVVGDVLRESLSTAVSERKLRPVGDPLIDPFDAQVGAGLSYTATFEVYPEIALAPVEQLRFEKPVCSIDETDIDKMVETLRYQQRDWQDIDRAAQTGDRVIVSFNGTVDGAPFEGGSAEDLPVELGAARLIAGFEERLLGTEAGAHKELQLRFPADFNKQELAGKPVIFAVTVKKVQQAVLPELDSAFFAKYGVKEIDINGFRQDVRANMIRERDAKLERRFRAQVLAALAEANPIALPKTLVNEESARLLQQVRQMMAAPAEAADKVDGVAAEAVAEQARKRVHVGLLMAETIKQAGLQVDPEKVRARVESIASGYRDAEQVIRWLYQDRQRLAEIESQCLEDDALNWLVQRAQVTETPVAFDALMKNGQTEGEHKADG